MGVADGLERLERAESRRRKWNQKVGGGTGETRCGPDGLEFRFPPTPFTSSKPGRACQTLPRHRGWPSPSGKRRGGFTARKHPGERGGAQERELLHGKGGAQDGGGETSTWEGV